MSFEQIKYETFITKIIPQVLLKLYVNIDIHENIKWVRYRVFIYVSDNKIFNNLFKSYSVFHDNNNVRSMSMIICEKIN